MMKDSAIRTATAAEEASAIDVIVLAFSADPMARWSSPDAKQYPEHFPCRQGQGHGSALLRHALERCDRDHLPAYLDATNPRNISLYERHGFERLGRIQVGTSPPLVPMLRKAR
jgi:GNAT superfamily N-acetyltransferase